MAKSMKKIAEKLNEYAQLEGTELGEMWSALAMMWECHRDMISKEFRNALGVEMEEELKNIEIDFEVVEREVTRTHKVRRLEPRED